MARPGWHAQGACHNQGLHLFFPAEDESRSAGTLREKKAKEWCSTCPVRRLCRDYALDTDQKGGVWGGLTEKERASLLRRRRLAAAQITSKSCRECEEAKPVGEFGEAGERTDGLNSVCKGCTAAAMRVRRQQDKEAS